MKKINESTKCWICHRIAKDVLDMALRDLETNKPFQDYGYLCCMNYVKLLNIDVPVCYVCHTLIDSVAQNMLESYLDIESINEIITEKDLEKLKVKIVAE